jgi:hypothetical protein
MPVRRLPASFVAVRALSLGGTAFAPGATVSTSVVKTVLGRHLDAYVSRGWLRPNLSQYVQTAKRAATTNSRHFPPYHLNSKERASL